MIDIQHSLAWQGDNRYSKPFARLDCKKQLIVLLDVFGSAHSSRAKAVADHTKKKRAHELFKILGEVDAAGYKLGSLLNLDQRHIKAAVDSWNKRLLAPPTLHGRFSNLRWMARKLGKPGLVLSPQAYGLSQDRMVRRYVATEDKSWITNKVDADDVIKRAEEMDAAVSLQLSLMKHFALRVSEAILIKPRVAHNGQNLVVEDGTKGGKTRIVPIRSQDQLDVLAKCKDFSMTSSKGTMIPNGMTPQKCRQRLYYVCRKLGISKAQSNVTSHGLRHEYANDRYEEISGERAVVRGGSTILQSALEELARLTVSQELGHRRTQITAAYTGSQKKPGPKPRDNKSLPTE